MHLIDIVTAYLYGSLDSDIYMKIPEGFKMPEGIKFKTQRIIFDQITKIVIWVKAIRTHEYNLLSEYSLKEVYVNNSIYPYIFIKKTTFGFIIIVVYVDDLNIIGTYKDFESNDVFKK